MAQAKKFGTFGGVFTPSILTILGVIMYLRLGYVVGEAGFYAALALIIIAHIISVSTGLSLSSIATDKKIKTGGVYYMLSRSLGLAMGGSIGITLFLGTALSIALYIVGFVENFLSIDIINHFLGMDGSVGDIRIIGTAVIILLVIIAYISTSIAIKTQFFILGAIALSLVSIFIGVFTTDEFAAVTPAISAAPNAPDLIVLFAIFFPAVTGFTAGVAMSGDLKSPKDSIPKGTLMSIAVGFIVYIGLATLFAFFVDRDLLISDTNFLQKIAWFSPLVIAGIWGATLSSALGGILGAPRIFQAMSIDKVTPAFFAKGVGKANEPRRALILTFLLAEVGILIGELDAIARLVSMFYIAAYGFINLAYVLERWSNSDFRPSLKISIWIGIIGFAASIFVMMNLDALGMLAAFVIMFGIYVFLKRKEVHGNMNDVWQSVWTSIIRTSLNRINKKPLSETNWQPNILLFSGGTNTRTHLMDFGLSIAGNHGFLSNFDLVLRDESEVLLSKSNQKIATEIEEQYTGVFTRKQSVSDIYDGIEMISQTYGFSGVEPNTVMLGWARQTSDPFRFSQMVRRLTQLDMNVVLLDYDKNVGWGKKQSIDIWWRGGGHNGNLALTLAKFITLSDEWSQAKIRLLIVNPNSDLSASIYADAKDVLDNLRIDAEIMILNNEIEKRSFYDIIQLESVNTDLTFLGFSPIIEGKEESFVEKTNVLCKNIGTVAIIQASSQFKKLSLGKIKPDFVLQDNVTIQDKNDDPIQMVLEDLKLEESRSILESLVSEIDHLYHFFADKVINSIYDEEQKWLKQLKSSGDKSFDNLITRASNNQPATFIKTIDAQHRIFMRGQIQYADEVWKNSLERLFDEQADEIDRQLLELKKSFAKAPYRIKTQLNAQLLEQAHLTNASMKRKAAVLKPLISVFREIPYYVHLRELLQMYFPQKIYQVVSAFINKSSYDQFRFENQVFKTIQNISGIFDNTIELSLHKVPTHAELQAHKTQVNDLINQLIEERKAQYLQGVHSLKNLLKAEVKSFIAVINHPLCNSTIDYDKDYSLQQRKDRRQIAKSIEVWRDHQGLIENLNELNIRLLSFRFTAQNNINDLKNKLLSLIDENLGKSVKEFAEIMVHAGKKEEGNQQSFIENRLKNLSAQLDIRLQQGFLDQLNYSLKRIKSSISDFPDTLSIISDSFQKSKHDFDLQQFDKIEVAVKRTLDYMVERDMLEVRELLIGLGQEFNTINTKFSEIIQGISIPTS
jgi:amino acid transporter